MWNSFYMTDMHPNLILESYAPFLANAKIPRGKASAAETNFLKWYMEGCDCMNLVFLLQKGRGLRLVVGRTEKVLDR